MTLNPDIFKEKPQSQDRAIKELEKMGYEYISKQEAESKRKSLHNVLYYDVLRDFLATQKFSYNNKKNIPFSQSSIANAINDIDVSLDKGMAIASKEIYDMLLLGKSFDEKLFDGNIQSFDLNFIDWDTPSNNIFHVTEEFSVERSTGKFARPDIVIHVNGIPLVVIECKNSLVDIGKGIKQNCRNMMPDYIPQLFKFAQLVIACNPQDLRYATSMTPPEFYSKWHEEDYDWLNDKLPKYLDEPFSTQDKNILSLLNKDRLLKIIRHYILYDNSIKKIARYQQFFAVENLIKRIKGEDSSLSKGGVVWHTQGSGKSLTMVMFVKRVFADKSIKNPRFVLVCDRKNLVKQLRDNFIKTGLPPVQAKTGKNLYSLLENKDINIICTTINKFDAAAKYNKSIADDNIFLIVDESHRSHGGEFHTLMNNCLPNATKIGFTGTPLLKKDKDNTYVKFGEQVGDPYRFEDGIRDNVIVPLIYEGRIAPQTLSNEKIDDFLQNIIQSLPEEQQEDLRKKWSSLRKLAETIQIINMIAFDIHQHFINYCKPRGFKAMITCSSRLEAVRMQEALNSLGGLKSAALISKNPETSNNSKDDDSESAKLEIKRFFATYVKPNFGDNLDRYENYVKDNINGGSDLDIVIVKDMLLTGFDAPSLAVLYVDKLMKEHTLLQAIARVNRIYIGKDFGLIIDYRGLFSRLNEAMEMYSDEKSGLNGYDLDDIKQSIIDSSSQKDSLLNAHNELLMLFASFDLDRNNSQSWIKLFDEDLYPNAENLRKDFYEKLKSFSSLMTLALNTCTFYKIVGFDKMQNLKKDLKFFQNIRISLMNVHDESSNSSKYEDGIRSLLNTFISSTPVENIIKPILLSDERAIDKELEKYSDSKTKAAFIKTRLIAELEANRYDDPLKYKSFSKRINDTLEEYKKSRNDDSYLDEIKKLVSDFKEGFSGYEYPTKIQKDNDAKAFYGIILEYLTKHKEESDEMFKEEIGTLGFDITNSIRDKVKIAWHYNASINKRIKQDVEDLLWDFADLHNFVIDIEDLDSMIEKITIAALKRF